MYGASVIKIFFWKLKMFFQNRKSLFLPLFKQQTITVPIAFRRKIPILKRRMVNEDTLRKYGFESLQEFQSFCYTDYCYKKLIEEAKKHSWFNNTIFVFTGDHGVEGEASAMYPDAWTSGRLSDEHVPLLFYAPELITPQTRNEVVSQIDILPTVAGMLHMSYTNTTLGRDLLHSKNKTMLLLLFIMMKEI